MWILSIVWVIECRGAALTCYLLNISNGGQCSQSKATRTATFSAVAPMKLKAGQLRPNKMRPTSETAANRMAAGRHQFAGSRMP